jgi:hypothetical protein
MEPLGDPLGSTDWVLRDGYHANGLPVIEPLQLRLWADVIGLANLGWDNSLPSRSHGRPHEHHLAGSLQDFSHKCKMLSRSPIDKSHDFVVTPVTNRINHHMRAL